MRGSARPCWRMDWRRRGDTDAKGLTGARRRSCRRIAWRLHRLGNQIECARAELQALERQEICARLEYDTVTGAPANAEQLTLALGPLARADLPLSKRRKRGAA